jgi:peroxiredoxin
MRWALVLIAAGCGALSAGALSFSLPDTAGQRHSEGEWRSKKAVVVFFTMTDCPLSNGYVPEMNRIAVEYSGRGVAVFAAHSDPSVKDDAVRKHAQEYGFMFPVLLDAKLTLAKAAGAKTVPEVAVFSGSGELLYLGRIDNRMEDITRRRAVVTEHELRDALDAVLAGKAPKVTRTRAVGCSIP